MAKINSLEGLFKTNFGKKKNGKARKSRNKHDKSERNYRGQGR
jgi:hypothetical protein